MKLILKSFQSDAAFAAKNQNNQDASVQPERPDEKHRGTQGSLNIPSGCCVAGKPVNVYRMAICQSAGECIRNRRLGAPAGNADFFA